MPKYCPDPNCEFHDQYRRGIKDANYCEKCGNKLVPEKPDKPIQTNANTEDHISEEVIQVINPKETRYFNIHFNSLLYSEHCDQIDKVCLRIGHIYFRNFEVCIVLFNEVRKVTIQAKDYIHIQGTLNFPATHIDGNRIYFPYRYYLFMKDGSKCYENMRHPEGIEYNRLFDIRIEEQINVLYVGQDYHHYDIMILPERCNCELFISISFRRYLSLLTLLPCYFNMKKMDSKMLIEDFISKFKKIVKMLNEFGIQDLRNISNRDRIWSSSQVIVKDEIKLIETWLLHSEILGLHVHTQNIEYILYQIYLACYLINIYIIRNDRIIEKLVLYMEKFINYILQIPKNILEAMIITESKNFKVHIEDSLEQFIFDLVMLNTKYQEKALFLLPFFHKIRPTLTQSQENYPEFTNSEYWGFPENCSKFWQDGIELSIIENAMTRAQHDEILPYSILLYTLNERNVQDLYLILTTNLLHGRLSLFIKLLIFRLHIAKKNDICVRQDNKLRYNVITFLDATLSEEADSLDSQDIDSLNKLTVQLITEELPLQFIDRDLFISVLKLLSHGLAIISSRSTKDLQVPLIDPTSLFEIFFRPWYFAHIVSVLVDNVLVQKDLENEIKFIDDVFLCITFLPIFQWDHMMNYFLENRFEKKKVEHQNIVDLFLFLHDGKRHSEKLQNLIYKILIERIQAASSLERQLMLENFSDLTKVSSFEKVREILSKILLVENEVFLNNPIPIEHFISWTSWITYFQILNSNDFGFFLSENAQSTLVSASERFVILINSLKEFQFSISEIQKICKNEDQFLKLAKLITIKLPPNGISSIRASLLKSKNALECVIYQTTELKDLSQLLNKCQSVDNRLIDDFLSQNIKETPIIDLCDYDGDIFTLKQCFDISKIFNFSHFSQMMRLIHLLKNSDIFVHILEKQLKMIPQLIIKFDIELLYNEAWLPALNVGAQLIDKFDLQTILISEVYELITDLSDQNKIMSELKILNSGCSIVKTRFQTRELQFKKCAHAIFRLHQFEKWDCVQAAEIILEFRDTFLIKSDFSLIEALTENTKDFFITKSLIEITEHIVKTVESLEYLKDNGLDIIEEFLKYKKFIQWIKEKMKNLNEIRTFVDISLSAHGNDSIDYDKITSFSSVCNNFAPLIFEISAETSCDMLVANCKMVVENVKINKNLILMERLKVVGEDIEYWEDMIQCQSSVEESTIMQLNFIMKSGVFSLSLNNSLELSDVLTLTAEKGKNEKRFYNLNQLRELRSKLTLVVSKVEDKEIDCHEKSQSFILLLDILTEMASILIELVQRGEQTSLKYEFTCRCGGERDQLDIKCSELYELSESWKQKIENARKDHYFLNYFTISQIVLLQKGISSFLNNEECNNSEQLYHLLRLLNSDISKELINEALIKSKISKQNFHDFLKLGILLENIKQSSKSKISREFPNNFVIGKPNLVTVPSARVFEYILSLYKDKDGNMPLPRYHEVLLCSSQTSLEEINIFWLRALKTSKFPCDSHLYCLMNIEKLQYDVAMQAVSKFWIYQQESEINNVCYKLVLVCTEEEEELSYMATAFDDFKQIILSEFDVEDIKLYLNQKFTRKHTYNVQLHFPAWMADKDRSKVRMVVSESVGAGKSLYIANLQSDPSSKASKRVVIHGKRAQEGKLTTDLLSKSLKFKQGYLFHVDIASTVHLELEPLLFKLLILDAICSSNGDLWHCRAEDYYVIEITLNSKFMSLVKFVHLYPMIECIQPFESLKITTKSKGINTWNIKEMKRDEFLRVYGYLNKLMIGDNLDRFIFLPKNYNYVSHTDILIAIFRYCGISEPSWREVRNFVFFLNKQLLDCDESYYCDLESTERGWKGFKSFVVKFMIHMSKDFATPSLDTNPGTDTDYLTTFQILERCRWEKNPHPYIFFNQDRHTMTFLGFHITKDGHLTDSEDCNTILEKDIMIPQLFEILTLNRVDLQENYENLSKNEKIMKIASVVGINTSLDIDPDPGYVLTLDNVKKIIGILMRFRCNIPVVIMGETGCGKTRLVQFMCDLQAHHTGAKNMVILKVHGATTEQDVINKIKEAEKLAEENWHKLKLDTVLFFDEANTSSAISLIKEIMCDRRMYGEEIRSDIGLQFVAACNPYRKHSKEMLNKLNSAGLGFFTKNDKITDRLGDIPLRELVYRVMELPASMRPLVWDFGQLSSGIEKMYICEIVSKQLKDSNCHIHSSQDVVDALTEVMMCAQDYMRNKKDECSFVSLRDVERAMRVLVWFYTKLDLFQASKDVFKRKSHLEPQLSYNIGLKPPRTRISGYYDSEENDLIHLPETIHRYDSGLEMTRSESIEESCPNENPWSLTDVPVARKTINHIDYITYSLILSLAVCYRARLQERDTFDLQIAAKLKAPLTQLRDYGVISREIDRCQNLILDEMSIDKSIVKNGALKENVFMMLVCIQLKIPLFVVGKPGSSKSLAKSIISNTLMGGNCPKSSILHNFKEIQLISYQCNQLSTAEGIISVFQSCRNIQRKTGSKKFIACVVLDEVGLAEDSPLLPLKVLHPLLEGSSFCAEHDDIPLKSDDVEDQVAFIGISNWSLDPAKMNRGIMVMRADPDIDELEYSAIEICRSKSSGNSEIKSIENNIRKLAKAYQYLTKQEILNVDDNIREYYGLRDFYGLIKMLVFLCEKRNSELNSEILKHAVRRNFGGISNVDPATIFLESVHFENEDQDPSLLELIKANLASMSFSFYGQTRYLLLITENFSALNIILQSPDMCPKDQEKNMHVIFGSSFPNDKDYSAVCSSINDIKSSMETGKTIILLNLESLYEGLYDALNQSYSIFNKQRYVDLGLGTHRMKCRVHDTFKLIVIADRETVRNKFPTPLINRLEKHYITISKILTEKAVKISVQLSEWAKNFSSLDKNIPNGSQKNYLFNERDCFIGFNDETTSSIVFDVIKSKYPEWTAQCSIEINTEEVLEESKLMLLKITSIDAIFRLKNSFLSKVSDTIVSRYFGLHLDSLEAYLRYSLLNIGDKKRKHLTLATTHSRLLIDSDINQLKENLKDKVNDIQCFSLHQFQTEQQFCRELLRFLEGKVERDLQTNKKILLIQCVKGVGNAYLIACARHKCFEKLNDWIQTNTKSKMCISLVFLIKVSRGSQKSQFVSFCGGHWDTIHIDDICSFYREELPSISEMKNQNLYEIFSIRHSRPENLGSANGFQLSKLKHCLQSAGSRLDDSKGSEKRTLTRIHDLSDLMEDMTFLEKLCNRLKTLLREQYENSSDRDCGWLQKIANCQDVIKSSGTFRKAVNLSISKIITPLFSELIALLDRDGNLMLGIRTKDIPNCITNLWHAIFNDESLLVLNYKDIVSLETMLPHTRVAVLNNGVCGNFFQASFPFSWIINQMTSDLFKETTQMNENHELYLVTTVESSKRSQYLRDSSQSYFWMQFEEIFNETYMGKHINNTIMGNTEEQNNLHCYLNDFICMNMDARNQFEFKVFEYILLKYIDDLPKSAEITNISPNVLTIPKIQVVFEYSKDLTRLMQQAFNLRKELGKNIWNTILKLKKTKNKDLNHLEFVLVEEICSICSHKNELIKKEELSEKYVSQIGQFNILVEKALSLNLDGQDYMKDQQLRLTNKWNRIKVIQLFISSCILGFELKMKEKTVHKMIQNIEECADFSSVQVICVLEVLTKNLKSIERGTIREKYKIQATRFFINILVDVTFKSPANLKLNSDLVVQLLSYVKFDKKRTNLMIEQGNINLFQKDGLDPSPAFGVFLLQLLIRHRKEVIGKPINKLLKEIQIFPDPNVMKNILSIIVSSIEDSLHRQFIELDSFNDKIKFVQKYLKEVPSQPPRKPKISYELLECIGTLRFLSLCISPWIIQYYELRTQNQKDLDQTFRQEIHALINEFKDICLKQGFDELHTFLLKTLYNELREDLKYDILNKTHECFWIFESMTNINEILVIPDYFLIYGEAYIQMQSILKSVCSTQKKDTALQYFQNKNELSKQEMECLLYSFFQIAIETFTAPEQGKTLEEKFDPLRDFLTDIHNTDTDLLELAVQISSNNLGKGILTSLVLSTTSNRSNILLVRLIYHVAIMLLSRNYSKLFSPIAMIYQDPLSLKDKLFPTMMVIEILEIHGTGNWYKCPNGHPYFIGECGRPYATSKCLDCGKTIGGLYHLLEADNTQLDRSKYKLVKPGYILGMPKDSYLTGERSLSPAALKVLRALIHSTFIWLTCSKQCTRENMSYLVNSELCTSTDFPRFFYQHLDNDIRDLAKLTGKGFEEAIFMVHLIIKSIMQDVGMPCSTSVQLTNDTSRDKWEKEFDRKCIQPTLNPINTEVQIQMKQVLNKKIGTNNPLMRLVYENDENRLDTKLPNFWCCRNLISLEHFSQNFNTADLTRKGGFPLINKLLREGSSLFATRYLPDIVKLQLRLGNRFGQCLDRSKITNMRIEEFEQQINGETPDEAKEYKKLIGSVKKAWSRIGQEVILKGRLDMKQHVVYDITDATPLAYLIPSTREEGLLITALTDYLVRVHNSFVEEYKSIMNGCYNQEVLLREITSSHMIDYTENLQPLIMSHAYYSITSNQEMNLFYDFEGIEKELITELVQSKPLIVAENLRFERSRETYILGIFEKVRNKVKQIEIEYLLWKPIKAEIENEDAVDDVLIILDVIISFLASVGGDPEDKLSYFLYKVLKYPQITSSLLYSRRAECRLQLKHVLSFWRYLNLEKARKQSINDQIPFSFLEDEFMENVNEKEKIQLEASCKHFKMEKILIFLQDFILFFTVGAKDNAHFGFKDCVVEYAEENEWDLPKGFSDHFPDNIKLSQCAAAWAILAQQEDRILNPES